MSDVLVYPLSADTEPSDRSIEQMLDTGHYFHDGQRVTWFYTTDRGDDGCAYCQDGRCEQRVETCGSWNADVVIHDRPRVMQ